MMLGVAVSPSRRVAQGARGVGAGRAPSRSVAVASASSASSSSSASAQRNGARPGERGGAPGGSSFAERSPEAWLQDGTRLASELIEIAVRVGPETSVRRSVQAAFAVRDVALEALEAQAAVASGGGQGGRLGRVTPAALLRRVLEKLGATYIKLGQFVASSPSLFPAEYVEEMGKLLDSAEAVPWETIKRTVEKELGRPLGEVYAYVDPVPLATASVAQVHKARLRASGREVVIKVQKPGVGELLEADLSFVLVVAKVLEFLSPGLERTSLSAIVADIQATMRDECDFQKEATNMEDFARFLREQGLDAVATVPEVVRSASSTRVLTMERMEGVPLVDLEGIRGVSDDPEATLVAALNTWLLSVLSNDFFHADVHAGNLLVLQDGRVAFIDFGIVGRISPGVWTALQVLADAASVGDSRRMAESLAVIGATDGNVDLEAFARDIDEVMRGIERINRDIDVTVVQGPGGTAATVEARLSADDQAVNSLLLDVVSTAERNGVRFPREFGLLLKQALYFDRYISLLAPGLAPLQDERVMLGRRLGEQAAPQAYYN